MLIPPAAPVDGPVANASGTIPATPFVCVKCGFLAPVPGECPTCKQALVPATASADITPDAVDGKKLEQPLVAPPPPEKQGGR